MPLAKNGAGTEWRNPNNLSHAVEAEESEHELLPEKDHYLIIALALFFSGCTEQTPDTFYLMPNESASEFQKIIE